MWMDTLSWFENSCFHKKGPMNNVRILNDLQNSSTQHCSLIYYVCVATIRRSFRLLFPYAYLSRTCNSQTAVWYKLKTSWFLPSWALHSDTKHNNTEYKNEEKFADRISFRQKANGWMEPSIIRRNTMAFKQNALCREKFTFAYPAFYTEQ